MSVNQNNLGVVLQLLLSGINVFGTVYAVLSILKLRIEDVYSAVTLEGIDERDSELLVQRKQARIGITLIIYGWIAQIICSIVNFATPCDYAIALIGVVMIMGVLILIIHFTNKAFEEKYIKYRSEKERVEGTHAQSHTIGNF